jgi:hypothetical protein
MINLHTGEQTYVSRLRVRCSGLEPLAAQLRLASLLRAADVQPAGLAPSAIVCIRRLDDPRPHTVSLSEGNPNLPLEWQQCVRASIEQLTRRAPRPAHEAVAPDALCVVFADRAELLAALAVDWCERLAAARWWWRSLFKETIDGDALVKLWRETPEYVPGALEHLARRGRAVAFAGALAPGAARAILDSLLRRFALDALQVAVNAAPQNGSRAGTAAVAEASPPETFGRDTTRENFQLSLPCPDAGDAPWNGFAPESMSHELEMWQQCLLGVGLALQRAPVVARGGSFALRVRAWMNAPSPGRDANAAARENSNEHERETRGTSARRSDAALERAVPSTPGTAREQEGARAALPVPVFDNPQDPEPEIHDARAASAGFQVTETESSAPASTTSSHDGEAAALAGTLQDAAIDTVERAAFAGSVEGFAPEVEVAGQGVGAPAVESVETRIEEREADAPPVSDAETETMHVAPSLLEARVETPYGGLFHLVNLALFLELYGDFTAPAAPGIALSIWDFVALLGRRMVGAGVETDAVWPLLARLAGRGAGQSPGEGFRPPGAWRMDAGWLQKFPVSGGWRWAVSRGAHRQDRLQVIHPSNFVVLDVPLDREEGAEAQLARELEVYAHAFAGTPVRGVRPFRLRGRTPLARWVERVHLYARARLCLALGTGDARRAARLLCERHARVFVTATHVDIVMRLAELPFEVRVAGLDRDPGWIPAAGRIVAFHFE